MRQLHELGVVCEVVRMVQEVAAEQRLEQIQTLVLQIGQLSPMIPAYVRQCFPAAVDGTLLQDTQLEIEILPANGLCHDCGQVFNVVEHRKICPGCGGEDWDLLGGREFNIKQIVAC